MFATTVVTITDSDFPGWGDSFTKDGVTVSAEMIDDMYGNISGPGSFSTTLGNFTKIEVNANYVNISGEGWSGNSEKMTWTGNASSVSFTGDINGDEEGLTLKFTIEEPALAVANTLQLHVNDAAMGSVAVTNLLGSDIIDNGDGTYTVPEGAEVTLLATPNEGYEFTGWKASNTICDFTECEFVALPTVANPLTFDMYAEAAFMAEFAAVASQPAEPITVTWNSYDLPSYGSSFTKDGVTLTCDIDDSDLYGPGTFTTDLGNFTKIEVTAYQACYIDATGGWSGNTNQETWTGNAAIVPWGGAIYGYMSDVTIVFTIEPSGGETGIESIQPSAVSSQKVLRNGMLLIEKNGHIINVLGQPVR